MMECDEVIDYIDAAEFALATLREVWGRKQQASALAVAAFAFAQMSHECEDESYAKQWANLCRLVLWVKDLRNGRDPRCSLCKQNSEFQWPLPKGLHHQVLQ